MQKKRGLFDLSEQITGYIAKPFSIRDFVERVREALETSWRDRKVDSGNIGKATYTFWREAPLSIGWYGAGGLGTVENHLHLIFNLFYGYTFRQFIYTFGRRLRKFFL